MAKDNSTNRVDNTATVHENETDVPQQRLDNGGSAPGDSRTPESFAGAPLDKTRLNSPEGDFTELKEYIGDAAERLPLDNTPAGYAVGADDGRPMTQNEKEESE